MAAKSRRPTRRPRGKKTGVRRSSRRLPRRWLWLLLLALGLAGVLYALYLDQVVQARFEGRRWALPARVYARPLELYAGRPLKADELRRELERLGYARVANPERPGAYSSYRGRFLLRTRPFGFWDGEEPTRYLELTFSGGRIATLRAAGGGGDPALVRLEAPLIASIYPSHHEDRILVRRDGLPELLVKTLLAVEDRNFYRHHGVAPLAILRAMWSNLRAGRVVQGGSTLTQQLVKNFYLSSERSLWRKLNEALMALLLERRYGKDELLEAYANEIYLGQDGRRAVHGFGLASRFYFNRRLAELDLPRIALLVGMIKGPSYYDPRRHPERARKRRDLVLELLAQQGVVSAAAARQARDAPLGVTDKGGRPVGRYPAFVELVRRQLKRDYREEDLRSEGLRIFTTLDPSLQARAEEAVARRLKALEKRRGTAELEAAVVVSAVDSGEVLALVGGRRSGYSGFNRALEAVRPIGSLIKPAVYLEALSRPDRYSLTSPLDDRALQLKAADGKPWRPRNFDGREHGEVPLYLALARSYNLATVRLGLDLGLDRVVRRLRGLGVQRPLPEVPALLLGAVSLPPLEVAELYQGFAGGGFRTPLRSVRDVLDRDGHALSRYPLELGQAADPGAVYLLDWALQQVVEQGTGRGLKRILPAGLRVAGKTGTTNESRDSWFAGFSGDRLAVVWVGRDDNRPMGLTGASGAMGIWGDIIAHSHSRPLDPPVPEGIVLRRVAGAAGLPGTGLEVPFLGGGEASRSAGRGEGTFRRAAREAAPKIYDMFDRLSE